MIYVKLCKPSGFEQLLTASGYEYDPNTAIMTVFTEDEDVELDMLNGDAVYVMTRHGETMSSLRPRR